jgi:hypothetical protein
MVIARIKAGSIDEAGVGEEDIGAGELSVPGD